MSSNSKMNGSKKTFYTFESSCFMSLSEFAGMKIIGIWPKDDIILVFNIIISSVTNYRCLVFAL